MGYIMDKKNVSEEEKNDLNKLQPPQEERI
jgi:hypothetical protein